MAGIAEQVYSIEKRLNAADRKMNGFASIAKREFKTLPSINGCISAIESSLWTAIIHPTNPKDYREWKDK